MENPPVNTLKIKVHVRPVKLGDIPQVIAVNELMLAENYPEGVWKGMFNLCKHYSYVAIVAHQIVGYVYCDGELIMSIAVLARYHGYGIGRQLMNNCLASCTADTRLQVRITNVGATALYKSLGFTIAGFTPDYYVNPACDAYQMEHSVTCKHFRCNHITATHKVYTTETTVVPLGASIDVPEGITTGTI